MTLTRKFTKEEMIEILKVTTQNDLAIRKVPYKNVVIVLDEEQYDPGITGATATIEF